MTFFWIGVGIIFAALAAIFAAFFRGLVRRGYSRPAAPDWVNRFSAARYRPMERLLDEEDCRFVESFAGADAALVRRLRSERRRIFRMYLRSMERDFHHACAALRALIVDAPEDRSDLAALVLRQQVAFAFALARVRYRLVLHTLGIAGVDIAPLAGCLDRLRLELQSLTPATAPAAA